MAGKPRTRARGYQRALQELDSGLIRRTVPGLVAHLRERSPSEMRGYLRALVETGEVEKEEARIIMWELQQPQWYCGYPW